MLKIVNCGQNCQDQDQTTVQISYGFFLFSMWSDPFQGQANQSDQSGSEDSLYHLLQEFIAENNSLKESNRID